MSKVTEKVETIIQPVLDELNYDLVEVEFVKEGKDHFLRISIDKPGGVDLNDCTLASEKISEVMDEEDPIPEMYYLDVASPGAERPIKKEKEYQNAVTQPIFVSLYAPIDGSKEYLGILKSVDEDTIVMEIKVKSNTKDIEIPRNKIAKARHAVMI
ncbi:ribosome maturation factor RimP [Staphylococcus massiliensis]|uniref:Ribosome maturation factor RimP n=1 Tax=Staphylococcus massiliensis S46 TaxID=1229783 RepID=K9ASW7_9STAP|nr:ribosome maturation factor RimP [Staphylococcus massiliensis]EKU50483.1 ribosome maturation protein RimP [Staphylococcus massiliensis S46]MCG3398746.1 ribosome maturation factor RimP [Staphylococcus massiliensis]MCG3401307.1 ribosome maturation factor RimP [Staphylococcus massiliensis]MCG3411911.1 ribosome maturation factor RimP [Staphylococcus massiliensis]POA00352.1 ribosome maturation factor RimP [Staphylococcus massiliensis CCUG 55927]